MNRYTALFLFTFGVLLLEPLLLFAVPLFSFSVPELGLIAVIYCAHGVRGSLSNGAAVALGIGYLTDLYSGAPVGMHALVYVLVYFLVRATFGRILGRALWLQVLFGALPSGVAGLLVISIEQWLNPVAHSWAMLGRLPWQMLVTGLFAPPFFWVLWRVDRMASYEVSSEGVFK
jgi:rod shape-determining protein MreD